MSSKTSHPRPLRAYQAPDYPTISDICRDDLARPPARWARLKSVVASLGTVAMTMKALAQDAAQVDEPKTELSPEAPKAVKPANAEAAAAQPATDVCPLLPVAVAGEGRGAFGCVSINPPVMLAECEALEIIEREFAKRGIVLKDCPELDGVELPSKPGKRQPVMLDLGSEQGDILVEFISLADDGVWTDPPDSADPNVHGWSSVDEWDLREKAERVTGKPLEKVDFEEVRGTEGLKFATYKIGDLEVKVAVASGTANAKKLLRGVEDGTYDVHFIEIMACPGGCVNGGGQPTQPADVRNKLDLKKLRASVLYNADANKLEYRKSHENPLIKKIYDEFLGEPNSHKAHELLHTHYVKRGL